MWLRNYPLDERQLERIKNKKYRTIEKYIQTMKNKRESRLNGYYKKQKERWLPLSDNEEFIAGLFLYWGEGNKASRNSLNISNTDPAMMRFALYWFKHVLKVPQDKFKIQLQLYKDMDIDHEIKFWVKELRIKKSCFIKPYIKDTLKKAIDQKGGYGHGTCCMWVHNTILKENMMMALKAMTEFYRDTTKVMV